LVAQARSQALQGNTEEARRLYDRAVREKPDDVTALLGRGQLELEAGELATAEVWLRRLVKVDPGNIQGRDALHLTLSRLGRPTEEVQAQRRKAEGLASDGRRAKELLAQQEQNPKNPAPAAELGELFLRQGLEVPGVSWLHRAINLDPKFKRAHEVLIRHYERTNQPKKAEEHYQFLREHNIPIDKPALKTS